MNTLHGTDLPDEMLDKYLKRLVGRFFKILPIKESDGGTLADYMRGFQAELLGAGDVVACLHNDEAFLSLVSILQYLIDHECSTKETRREVFNAISICKDLRKRHCEAEV